MIDIHRQLSSLKYFAIESVSKCIPPPPPGCNDAIKDDAHIHTSKVLFAAEKINNLLTLPTRFTEHTPFIICMITVASIAQLSACQYIFKEPRLSLERDKIRLNMGVLKMMGEVWTSGSREYQAMGIIAREILSIQDDEVQVPELAAVVPVDAMDFNYDFDVNWGCDSFASINALDFTADMITI